MSPDGRTAAATATPQEGAASPTTAAPVASPERATSQREVPTCANCGASVQARYCGRCGQRLEHEIHSVWHFTQEATEDLTHADSRLWGTVYALLFKPGFLTREFLEGRRVRYLPPLRLYLVLSVVFFFIIGSGHHNAKAVTIITDQRGEQSYAVVPADVGSLAAKPGETPEQRADRICKPEYDGPARDFVLSFIKKACRTSVLDNGRTISQALMHNLPRAMFIFLPALAVLMKLMYWHPRRFYIEHLLFFVHNHAFAFALFGVYALLGRLLPAAIESWVTAIVWLYFPYYVFVSMRRVYGQGWFRTSVKFTALAFTYFIGAVIALALTLSYSVYSL
jgi:hypothetical protein